MAPFLTIDKLSVAFSSGEQTNEVVKQVSLNIKKKEIVALVGESGSGKSVTALSIMQLLPYPIAKHPSGSIKFNGQELVGTGETVMQTVRGNEIAMIFQEPMTALNPLHTIEKQIAEVLWVHKKLNAKKARKRVIELLHLVGLGKLENRLNAYPHELSGGQRQRVMIAMALANEPKLLIADEPTTALDVTVQKQIIELLQELKEKLDMSILLITHDLHIVKHMADRIYVMSDGKMVETATTKILFAKPKHAYTKKLLASILPQKPPALSRKKKDILLDVNDVSVAFPIKKGILGNIKEYLHAVQNASFQLKCGTTLGIVGESGSGKTTLANAILKMVKAEGNISFNGQDITQLNKHDIRPMRRHMQLVFQDPFSSLNPRMPINMILAEGLKAHNLGSEDEQEALIIQALERVEINPESRFRYPHEFSGGQRQRIAIARAIILQPELIILDEPTSALDISVQAQIIELLRSLQKELNITYICISHDLQVIRALSHDILVLQQGKIIEYNTASKVLTKPKHIYTQTLLEAAMLGAVA